MHRVCFSILYFYFFINFYLFFYKIYGYRAKIFYKVVFCFFFYKNFCGKLPDFPAEKQNNLDRLFQKKTLFFFDFLVLNQGFTKKKKLTVARCAPDQFYTFILFKKLFFYCFFSSKTYVLAGKFIKNFVIFCDFLRLFPPEIPFFFHFFFRVFFVFLYLQHEITGQKNTKKTPKNFRKKKK